MKTLHPHPLYCCIHKGPETSLIGVCNNSYSYETCIVLVWPFGKCELGFGIHIGVWLCTSIVAKLSKEL